MNPLGAPPLTYGIFIGFAGYACTIVRSSPIVTNDFTGATPEVGPEQGKADRQQDPSQDPAEAVETEDRHRSYPWLFRSLDHAVVRATTHPAVPAQPPDPVGD